MCDINNIWDNTEEKISKFEGRSTKITQTEAEQEKQIRHPIIYVTGFPKQEKENRAVKIFLKNY